MKFEYSFDGMTLKILDESHYKEVLEYFYSNRDDFDKYDTTRPDNFYSEDFIKNLLRAEYNAFLKGSYIRFFLFSDDIPEKILGSVSFSHIYTGSTSSCVIGYKVDKAYRRLGLSSAMVSKAIEIIKKEKGIHRIEAYIHPENTPSLNFIKKMNFIDEGIAHSYANVGGSWQDHMRFVYIS